MHVQGGCTPGVDTFVELCAKVLTGANRCIIALEKRSSCVLTAFFEKAQQAGLVVVGAVNHQSCSLSLIP